MTHAMDIHRRLIEAAEFMEQGKAVIVPGLLRQAAVVIAAQIAAEIQQAQGHAPHA